jgi:hypothetical protein
MVSLPVLIGISAGISLFWHRRRARPLFRRLAVALIAMVVMPALLIGATTWIGGDDLGYIALILTESVLTFSLLWSLWALISMIVPAAGEPSKVLTGTSMGLTGALVAVVGASAVAVFRGAELARLDSTHAFYILVVPALAGFGWGAPRPKKRSLVFAAMSGLLILAMAWYAVPVHFMEPPRIECDHSYEPPRHNAYGFEYEPWRWKAYKPFYWTAAPGSLAELTLRHIAQPLVGYMCDGMEDVPTELDAYDAFAL